MVKFSALTQPRGISPLSGEFPDAIHPAKSSTVLDDNLRAISSTSNSHYNKWLVFQSDHIRETHGIVRKPVKRKEKL